MATNSQSLIDKFNEDGSFGILSKTSSLKYITINLLVFSCLAAFYYFVIIDRQQSLDSQYRFRELAKMEHAFNIQLSRLQGFYRAMPPAKITDTDSHGNADSNPYPLWLTTIGYLEDRPGVLSDKFGDTIVNHALCKDLLGLGKKALIKPGAFNGEVCKENYEGSIFLSDSTPSVGCPQVFTTIGTCKNLAKLLPRYHDFIQSRNFSGQTNVTEAARNCRTSIRCIKSKIDYYEPAGLSVSFTKYLKLDNIQVECIAGDNEKRCYRGADAPEMREACEIVSRSNSPVMIIEKKSFHFYPCHLSQEKVARSIKLSYPFSKLLNDSLVDLNFDFTLLTTAEGEVINDSPNTYQSTASTYPLQNELQKGQTPIVNLKEVLKLGVANRLDQRDFAISTLTGSSAEADSGVSLLDKYELQSAFSFEATLAAKKYTVFLYPFLPDTPLLKENNNGLQSVPYLYAVGLVAVDKNKLHIPAIHTINLFVLVAMAVLLYPLLHQRLIGDHGSIPARGYATILLTGVLMIALGNQLFNAHTHYQALKRNYQTLAEQYGTKLAREFDSALTVRKKSLHSKAQEYAKSQGLVDQHCGTGTDGLCVITGDGNEPDNLLFDQRFATDANGQLDYIHSYTEKNREFTKVINVSSREYFKTLKKEETDFALQRIYNWSNGRKDVQMAVSRNPAGEWQGILAGSTSLPRFSRPVIPYHFQFLIYEKASGVVVLHSEDRRSLTENIYQEVDNALLNNLERDSSFEATLYAERYAIHYRPVNDNQHGLLVMYPLAELGEQVAHSLTISLFAWLLLALAALALIKLVCRLQNRPYLSLWPNSQHPVRWLIACTLALLMGLLAWLILVRQSALPFNTGWPWLFLYIVLSATSVLFFLMPPLGFFKRLPRSLCRLSSWLRAHRTVYQAFVTGQYLSFAFILVILPLNQLYKGSADKITRETLITYNNLQQRAMVKQAAWSKEAMGERWLISDQRDKKVTAYRNQQYRPLARFANDDGPGKMSICDDKQRVADYLHNVNQLLPHVGYIKSFGKIRENDLKTYPEECYGYRYHNLQLPYYKHLGKSKYYFLLNGLVIILMAIFIYWLCWLLFFRFKKDLRASDTSLDALSMTYAQKWAVYQLAHDKLPNPANKSIWGFLQRKSIIDFRPWPQLNLSNKECNEVLDGLDKRTIDFIEQNYHDRFWDLVRTPFILLMVLLVMFVLYQTGQSFAPILGLVSALATLMSAYKNLGTSTSSD